MKFILLSILIFSSSIGYSCEPFLKFLDDTQIHRDSFKDGTCFVSVHTAHAEMIYRDYLITSDGMLMVFNSFGEDESSSQTAARVFYFFPRTDKSLNIEHRQDKKEIDISFAASRKITFNSINSQIKYINNQPVDIASEVRPDNNGGVEIKQYDGLYLDVGYSIGHSPQDNKNSFSIFHDELKQTCRVRNNQIFKYLEDGNSFLKFTDNELKQFLRNECPKLKVNF